MMNREMDRMLATLSSLGDMEFPSDGRSVVTSQGADDFSIEDVWRGDGGDSAFQTDFERNMELRALAMFGPHGHVLSDMDHLFYHTALREKDSDEIAPNRNINPASVVGATLGGHASILPGQPPQQVVFWHGDDREATACTVTWDAVNPQVITNQVPPQLLRAQIQIIWGSRDGTHTVLLDAGTGGQLTICASTVQVNLLLDSTSVGNTAYVLSASLAFMTATRTQPILLTSYLDGQAGGGGGKVRVNRPAFASQVAGFERSDPTQQYTLDFIDTKGSVVYEQIIAANGFQNNPIMVTNDVVAIDVTAGGAGGNGRLGWGISL